MMHPTPREISPQALAEALKAENPPRLLDVRTPEEQAIAKLDASLLLTQESVEEIIATWPKDTPMVFYCHHGVRSEQAATYFMSQGFTQICNLQGGIDAWAVEVDPSLPRY